MTFVYNLLTNVTNVKIGKILDLRFISSYSLASGCRLDKVFPGYEDIDDARGYGVHEELS